MNCRASIFSSFITCCHLAGQAWGAGVDRSAIGVLRNAAQNSPIEAEKLTLLHTWSDVVLLGFNSAGHCLMFNSASKALDTHDLPANRGGTRRLCDKGMNRIGDLPAMKVGRVPKMIFCSDNRRLTAYEDEFLRVGEFSGNIRVWEVANGQLIGPPQPIRGMFLDWHYDRESRFLAVSYIESNGHGAKVFETPFCEFDSRAIASNGTKQRQNDEEP